MADENDAFQDAVLDVEGSAAAGLKEQKGIEIIPLPFISCRTCITYYRYSLL
jgi:hypothetical protein